MIQGSCLCGGIRFEIRAATGPVEICHCNRCRKRSGAASLTMVTVLAEDYRLLSGKDLIKSYGAPILYAEPAYRSFFCSHCGSPAPPVEVDGESLEIPAGLFDEDFGIRPNKHIFIEFLPVWDRITDDLPQYTIRDLLRERQQRELPEDFQIRSHYDKKTASKEEKPD